MRRFVLADYSNIKQSSSLRKNLHISFECLKFTIEQWQALLAQLEVIESFEGREILTAEDLLTFETQNNIVLPATYKEFCQVFGSLDLSRDIYWVSIDFLEEDRIYQVGRNFFEFVRDFCLGLKSQEVLPESIRPLPSVLGQTFTRFNVSVTNN